MSAAEWVVTVRHRARRERDGSYAVMRIERVFDAGGAEVRVCEAIVMHGLPNEYCAANAAYAHHRMQEVAAP